MPSWVEYENKKIYNLGASSAFPNEVITTPNSIQQRQHKTTNKAKQEQKHHALNCLPPYGEQPQGPKTPTTLET